MRSVRLTESGRRSVAQVHDAIDIPDQAIKTAGMQARGEEGDLRIGVQAVSVGCFLDRLTAALPVGHPPATQPNVEWRELAAETFLVCHDVGHDALPAMVAAGRGISLFVAQSALASTAHVRFLPSGRREPDLS